jgi:membrane protease YdiL (CAAX protease family)
MIVRPHIFVNSLLVVAAAWFVLFSGVGEFSARIGSLYFWPSIAVVSGAMILFVMRSSELRHLLQGNNIPLNIGRGLLHGLLFSALTIATLVAAREFIPQMYAHVHTLFALRNQLPATFIALILVVAVAPAEELFWRGYVQSVFSQRMSPANAVAAMAATDAVVHMATGNYVLVVAAAFFGWQWGLLRNSTQSLVPCVISHAVWDLCVFLVYPTVIS